MAPLSTPQTTCPAQPLRILAVTLRYPPYEGGGYELLNRDAVEELRARGHDVRVLTNRGEQYEGMEHVLPRLEPGLDEHDDVWQSAIFASNLERLRLHFFRRKNYQATSRVLAEFEPDVVLYLNMGLLSLAPILAVRHRDIPSVAYVADAWPGNHWVRWWREDSEGSNSKSEQLAALERTWASFRRHVPIGPVLACSENLRAELLREGVPDQDLSVLPLGMLPAMQERAEGSSPSPRSAGEALRVLCISHFWEGKGQHHLLEGVAIARAQGVPVKLSLAGSGAGAYRQQLEERAHEPDLAGHVKFLGRLAPDDLSVELRRSHVLAMPSVWEEPFGLATIEGMANALAVVASDSGASPEIIEDGESGLIVPRANPAALAAAFARLDADEGFRQGLAEQAVERVAGRYTHRHFVDGLEGALRRVAGLEECVGSGAGGGT